MSPKDLLCGFECIRENSGNGGQPKEPLEKPRISASKNIQSDLEQQEQDGGLTVDFLSSDHSLSCSSPSLVLSHTQNTQGTRMTMNSIFWQQNDNAQIY